MIKKYVKPSVCPYVFILVSGIKSIGCSDNLVLNKISHYNAILSRLCITLIESYRLIIQGYTFGSEMAIS